MRLMQHRVYLGLGSNLGDRRGYLDAAAAALSPEANVLRRSPIYETAPWGFADQPNFLNQVLEAVTELEPVELLAKLKEIERKLGRQERFRNGPREIDIDILLYDDLVLKEGGLQIPHPRMHERAFILGPLADLAPGLVAPGQEKTVSQFLEDLDIKDVHRVRG